MKKRLTIIIVLYLLQSIAVGQSLVINEVMSDNTSSLADSDSDYSDWLELYNGGQTPINLGGYCLSDDANNLHKWDLPALEIPPYGHLLVFASGKDVVEPNAIHTNFRIAADGEALFLSISEQTVDQVPPVTLTANQVYQREQDGSDTWVKSNLPSPGTSNLQANALSFSHDQGFYDAKVELEIDQVWDHQIYYTLNGDIPTEQSQVMGDKLLIADRSSTPNVFSEIRTSHLWEAPDQLQHKATTLRCASYHQGVRTSPVYTRTYFVDPEMGSKYTMPVVSLVTEGDNLFDHQSGIYVQGVHYDPDDPDWSGNYYMSGREWEREIHIEYFSQSGDLRLSQDAGARIHGGKTRISPQKSLRLYAREEYGEKYFNYPIFPQKEVAQYKRLILRTTMAAWGKETIIKDAMTHQIASKLDLEYQDYQPVIVYLNGEYWGIHTLRDRIDERFLGYSSGIDKDSVEIKEWENPDYNNLLAFIEGNDLSIDTNYEKVIGEVDIENFIDYMITELFFSNYDWPANNIKVWRELPDGKWRWILYDLDGGYRRADYDMMAFATLNDPSITDWPNPPYSTFLFRHLLKSQLFRDQFIERYAELLNNDYSTAATLNHLTTMQAIYQPEIADHSLRWHFPEDESTWQDDIESELEDYLVDRPCFVRQNLIEFFDLSEFGFECDPLSLSDADDLLVSPNPSDGSLSLWNNSQDLATATLTVYNIQGQAIYTQDLVDYLKSQLISITLPPTPDGVYIVSLESQQFSSQQRVLVIR